jgi:transmembrane sensor
VAEFNRYNQRPLVIRQKALAGKRFYGVFRFDDPEGFARAVHLSLNVPIIIDEKFIEIGR